MLKFTRLTGCSDGIQLSFVERVCTPTDIMRLGIRLHLSGLSLAKTVSILELFGIDRCRSTVHYWVKKADLEPRSGRYPEKIALDETVGKIGGE